MHIDVVLKRCEYVARAQGVVSTHEGYRHRTGHSMRLEIGRVSRHRPPQRCGANIKKLLAGGAFAVEVVVEVRSQVLHQRKLVNIVTGEVATWDTRPADLIDGRRLDHSLHHVSHKQVKWPPGVLLLEPPHHFFAERVTLGIASRPASLDAVLDGQEYDVVPRS